MKANGGAGSCRGPSPTEATLNCRKCLKHSSGTLEFSCLLLVSRGELDEEAGKFLWISVFPVVTSIPHPHTPWQAWGQQPVFLVQLPGATVGNKDTFFQRLRLCFVADHC